MTCITEIIRSCGKVCLHDKFILGEKNIKTTGKLDAEQLLSTLTEKEGQRKLFCFYSSGMIIKKKKKCTLSF